MKILSVVIVLILAGGAIFGYKSWKEQEPSTSVSAISDKIEYEGPPIKDPNLYGPSGGVARIRLQNEIFDSWEEQTPEINEVIKEIADTTAPDGYRIYITDLFRNHVKMNKFSDADVESAALKLITIVKDRNDSPLVRANIAKMLIYMGDNGKSTDAVNSIAPLLNESDEVGSMAVTALRHNGSDAAANILFEYLEKNYKLINSKPSTISSILMALSGYENVDITPILIKTIPLISSTEVLDALGTVVLRMKDSPDKVVALMAIYDASLRVLNPDQQANLVDMLKRNEDLINRTWPSLTSSQSAAIERARKLIQ